MSEAQIEKKRPCARTSAASRPHWSCLRKAPSGREALIREAFKLEWLTIGWMSVEATVALASGVAAGSLVLIAFGTRQRDRVGVGWRPRLAA